MRFSPLTLRRMPSRFTLFREARPNPISDRFCNAQGFFIHHRGREIPVNGRATLIDGFTPAGKGNPLPLVFQHVLVRPAAGNVEYGAVSAQPDRFQIGSADIRLEFSQIHEVGKVFQGIAPYCIRNAPQKLPVRVYGVFGNQPTKTIVPVQFDAIRRFYGGKIAQGSLPAAEIRRQYRRREWVSQMCVPVFAVDSRPSGHRQPVIFPCERRACVVQIKEHEHAQMRRIGLDIAVFDGVGVGTRTDACRQVIGAVRMTGKTVLQKQVRLMVQLAYSIAPRCVSGKT